ncbi:MAG: HigA family addiction module antitoxin [Bacillota bacterium]
MSFAPRIVRSRIGNQVVHPGRILFDQFMQPFGIGQNALARRLGVSPRRINEIVLGRRAITADTAIRLAAAMGTTEHFWLQLQIDYELERAHERLRRLPKPMGEWDPRMVLGDQERSWGDWRDF